MKAIQISTILLLVAALALTGSIRTIAEGQIDLAVTDSGMGTTFHPGDKATGYLVLANNGNVTVHDVSVTLTIYPDAMLGFPAGYKKQDFNVELATGESKQIEYSQMIPSTVIGISTVGHYRLEAKIEADGQYVTTLQRSVDIV